VVRAARRKGAARSYPCGPEVGRLLTVLSSSRGHRKRRAIGRVVLMLGWLIQPSSGHVAGAVVVGWGHAGVIRALAKGALFPRAS
jgi:hypothetical protein